MILFVGCSFTWGAGLQYEYLHNEENVSFDYINKNFLPPDYFLEHCSYKADKYRQEKHFPNLVAKHFNHSYCLGKNGNGGNNNETMNLLDDSRMRVLGDQGQCKLVVVQFTDWQRSSHFLNGVYNGLEYVKDQDDIIKVKSIILEQIEKIKNVIGDTKWIGISWFEDMGNILKKNFPNNYVPIFEGGEELTGFEKLSEEGGTRALPYTLYGWSNREIHDTHFNSYGHEFIAKQIIRKIEENNLL